MSRTLPRCRRLFPPAVVLLLALASPSVLAAAGDDEPRSSSRPAPDFLFREPRITIAVRGNLAFPRGGSDLYDFVSQHLTLDRSDLRGRGFAGDVGARAGSRLEIIAGVETSHASHGSEYRDFVDNLLLPIEQTTTLNTVSATAGVRVALVPRGRRISQLAWIPRGVTPYVGAGGGLTHYEFIQRGDFVDVADLNVFRDVFRSRGWTPSMYVSGGADVRVFRQLYVTGEGRYTWASAPLSDDFVGFAPIDLSGFRMAAGLSVIF